MTKKCGKCGNPAYDDSSVFCNKCGARLPVQEVLTCRKCGNPHSDLKSRFCNKCGTSLEIPVPPVSPQPADKGQMCFKCGFVNTEENSLFCKKCGTNLQKNIPFTEQHVRREKEPAIQIKSNNTNIIRLKDSNKDTEKTRMSIPVREGIPQKNRPGSFRKIAAIGTAVILIIIVIGILVVFSPGIISGGPKSETTNSTPVITPGPGISSSFTPVNTFTPVINQGVPVNSDTAPAINQGVPVNSDTAPVINQGVPVTTDSSLNLKNP